MDVSKLANGGSTIQGGAAARQLMGAAASSPLTKATTNANRSANPVDTVVLSDQASRALSVDLSPAAFATGAPTNPSTAAAVKDMDKIIPAMQRYTEESSRYAEKLSGLVREKFGLPDNVSVTTGGAANAMMDSLAKENGLVKPEIPQILKDHGLLSDDTQEVDSQSQTGLFGLSVTTVGDPDFGKRMDLAFDRSAAIPSDKQTLVALKSGDPATAGTLNRVKTGALGGLTDTASQDGAHLFAITDGAADGKAKVAASVRSVGMDDRVNSSALTLLATIKRYLPG